MAKTEKEKIRRFDISTPILDWDQTTAITKSDTNGKLLTDDNGETALFRVKDAILKICNHGHMMGLDKDDKNKLRRIGRLVAKATSNVDLLKDEYNLLKKLADDGSYSQPTGGGTLKIDLFGLDIIGQLQDVIDEASVVGSESSDPTDNGKVNKRVTEPVG